MMESDSSSSLSYEDSHLDGLRVDNQLAEVPTELVSDSDMHPRESGSPLTSRIESLQSFIPSGIRFLEINREQGVAVSSSIIPNGISSDRLFWDAFARRSSRIRSELSSIVLSTDDNDDQIDQHTRLLGLSNATSYDSMSNESRYLANRILHTAEPRQLSRLEIWERLRGVLDDDVRRSSLCPSGLHPDGSCSCESLSITGESSAHASISRVIMLAEALSEVLDEIHRHGIHRHEIHRRPPTPLSFSVVSFLAPGSIVDSFPVKNHAKVDNIDDGNDVELCYICLSEYEEGEKIRILPCHHEYHMSCVDKWLKEIHGVCPLCRGDVCEGVNESSPLILAE